jgi:hypothetical protein
MKFITTLILCIFLLAPSSFAISLTPPQIYAVKESRTIENTDDIEETFKMPQYMARVSGVALALVGFILTENGVLNLTDKELSSSNGGEAKMGLIAGIGMMILGGFCIYWSF